VRGVAPRIEFNGMLSNGVKSGVFMGSAVDPVAEQTLGFTARLATGRDLDSKPGGEIEALIGAGVARSMNVKPGDGLTILAVTSDGALNGIDVQVVGVVNTGFKEMDDRYLRITLPSAQRLLQSDRVTNLVVGLDNTDNTDLVAAQLAPRPAGASAAVSAEEMDRPGCLLQAGSLFVQHHLCLSRSHCFLHGADVEREYAADGHV
jgi:putative ABC transport system permease protein